MLAVIAILVKREDGGPVLFRQQRVGRGDAEFGMLKFRTMVVDAEARLAAMQADNQRTGPLFKMARDPRITRIGHVLRRTSLDELPQLINVLKGDMSLIGPRPALRREVDEFPADLHDRHHVRPGITGLWQVEARDNPAFDAYHRLDLHYVENWSLASTSSSCWAPSSTSSCGRSPAAPRRDGGRPSRRRAAFAAAGVRRGLIGSCRPGARSFDGAQPRGVGGVGGRAVGGRLERWRRAATAPRRRARSGNTPSARAARYAAPMAVVSCSVGRCTGTPSWSAWNCSSTSITDAPPSTRSSVSGGRWPAPSPRRHRGSGTPSTRRRPGRGGHGSCRG